MDEIWERIETWLAANAPTILAELNPPASEDEMAETERLAGIRFPDDIRASYRRHNGNSDFAMSLLEAREWLSMGRIRQEWIVWKDLLDGGDFEGIQSETDGVTVRDDWWNPAWIPLTYDGSGNHHCLDLAPGPEGVPGQIIEFWHDAGDRTVIAPNFRAWLADFAEGLETGVFVVSEEYGHIMRCKSAET